MDAAERKKEALDALKGCRVRFRSERQKPARPRKVSSIRSVEWFGGTRKEIYYSCRRKVGYRTESEAKAAAKRATAKRGTELRVYLCGHCGKWHLTKKMRKRPVNTDHDGQGIKPSDWKG